MPSVKIKIIQTGDIHGCFFPYDFIKRKEATACLSRISSYIKEERRQYGENLILLDSGDVLQGQPTCYYSSFVDIRQGNLAAKVYNYMGYDAVCIGNHDIETGHGVFDKWAAENKAAMLAANITEEKSGKPYFRPYSIFVRHGIRIAVLGITTNAITFWLGNRVWEGMRFENPVESARHWIDVIKEKERPDIIVGLFHTGWQGGISNGEFIENATKEIACDVDGFDIILFGHDHRCHNETVTNKYGNAVHCLNASSNAIMFNVAEVTFTVGGERRNILRKEMETRQLYSEILPDDNDLEKCFGQEIADIKRYVNKPIGHLAKPMHTRDCFFGEAPFSDLIHKIQLDITGADISFTAPLAFDEQIGPGEICVADVFNLYRYENTIYVLRLTGREIRKYLEYSYDQWISTMHSEHDHIMKTRSFEYEGRRLTFFRNLVFNFETAAGISYDVDVSKPFGSRIHIRNMASGKKFSEGHSYAVAMHSYRGNGGNEFLIKGAGIKHSELAARKIYESGKGIRDYIINEFATHDSIACKRMTNWKFIPAEWTAKAIACDRKLLFPDD